MKKNNVLEFAGRDALSAPDRFVEIGCQQLICQVVEAELQELLSQYSDQQTDDGNDVVVRNGHLQERERE